MKTYSNKIILFIVVLAAVYACSTKKNTFVNRNFHALNTKFNVLFNGDMALEKGIEELKVSYKDNFWDILPLERLDVSDEMVVPGVKKNPNFERAETKATKAIQKHSMNIDGYEYNYQMDEAHFTLGKSRYYDQRFLPALEAFNYVLYKYPNSSQIDEIKVWREKTNMRLGNNSQVLENIKKLIRDKKLKTNIAKEAEALLTQTFINNKEFDSALVHIKRAKKFSKANDERARFRFIEGQLYDALQKKDSAVLSYNSVIQMRRKSPRQYVIHAHMAIANHFDYKNGDKEAFVKAFTKLSLDKENKAYLGYINYQFGVFYDKTNQIEEAKNYYNKSLRSKTEDSFLFASNYRNLAEITFNEAKYTVTGKYFDSTLTNLKQKTRPYRAIEKKKLNLADVIKYEDIASKRDSVLSVVAMTENERVSYYEKHIESLKKTEADKIAETKRKEVIAGNAESNPANVPQSFTPPSNADVFYFYTAKVVQLGKADFKKTWGDRSLKDNWRYGSKSGMILNVEDVKQADTVKKVTEIANVKHDPATYISKIPTDAKVIDSLTKERNYAYYQLGMIYKDKFKRNDLSARKLEKLLSFNPEEKYVLPSLYNLYKMYLISDAPKAAGIKNKIVTDYPDSRYASILNNASIALSDEDPEVVYTKILALHNSEKNSEALENLEMQLIRFEGEPIVPKMELLKAYCLAKLDGLEAYKKALTFIAFTFPNVEEGKKADELLKTSIPELQQLNFKNSDGGEWKLFFEYVLTEDEKLKTETVKVTDFVKIARPYLTNSVDGFDRTKQFLVLHGFRSKQDALTTLNLITADKKLNFKKKGIIISNNNYKVIQINKNLNAFIEQNK